MTTLLRFFKPNQSAVYVQYRKENIPIPHVDNIVWPEGNEPYRVDNVSYSYDDTDVVMVDVELREVEEEYWDRYDETDLYDDEFECNGECEHCELNDAGITEDEPKEEKEDKTDYRALLRNSIADLFSELGVKVEFTKE